MKSDNRFSCFNKIELGLAIDMMFYCVIFFYFFILTVVGTKGFSQSAMDAINFFHIMLQTIWMSGFIFIWYGIGDAIVYSEKFQKARIYTLVTALLNLFMIVVGNSYNIWMVNTTGDKEGLFVYSNVLIIILNIIIFFFFNLFGLKYYVAAVKEILYKYGAEFSYEKKCNSIIRNVRISYYGLIVTVIAFVLWLSFFNISSYSIVEDIRIEKQLDLENISSYLFWILILGFGIMRIYVQGQLMWITRKTHHYIKSVSE